MHALACSRHRNHGRWLCVDKNRQQAPEHFPVSLWRTFTITYEKRFLIFSHFPSFRRHTVSSPRKYEKSVLLVFSGNIDVQCDTWPHLPRPAPNSPLSTHKLTVDVCPRGTRPHDGPLAACYVRLSAFREPIALTDVLLSPSLNRFRIGIIRE